MIRFALVFALFVTAAQATEVNLLRGSDRRLDGPDGEHGPPEDILECQGATVATRTGKIIGPNPNKEDRGNPDRPEHTPETCQKFCFKTYPQGIAHYHVNEHLGIGPTMHCRCHPPRLALVCSPDDGTTVYVNRAHPDTPNDFACPCDTVTR